MKQRKQAKQFERTEFQPKPFETFVAESGARIRSHDLASMSRQWLDWAESERERRKEWEASSKHH